MLIFFKSKYFEYKLGSSLVYNKKGIDMFVKSSMSVPVRYNKSTGSIELKPKTVTYVDENIISANELLACYGSRISILPAELVEEIIKEEADKKAKEESAEDLEIDTTLDEGKEEDEANEGTDKANEGEEGTDEGDRANEGEEGTDEANTGDKDVDDFLNGKTNVVPDGTTEITEEEALKLKEEADKKAKEEAEKAKKKTETTKAKTNKADNKQNKSKAGKNK